MKKALLLLLTAGSVFTASAQSLLYLTGSSYYQSFDNIGSGLPAGWELDSNATSTNKGTPIAFDVAANAWNVTTTTAGKGKNYAAKNGFTSYSGTSAATQTAATNRAMGVRLVGALDSQVAFTLNIAQTTGLSNLNLVFNLQSLDSTSPRVATWEVQYGIGANPASFTTVSTGTLTTGGYSFGNNVVSASFGSALNNQSGPVVIRIVNLHKTTGTGNRPSTAIDSLTLSWTGTAVVNQPQVVSLSPTNGSTNVSQSSNLVITFDKNVTAGAGSIYIKNATDQTTITKAANSSDVTIAGPVVTIANAGLVQGKMYRVMFDSNAFKSGIYSSFGIYDSTSWVFTTSMPVVTVTSLSEEFDASCATGNLPNGWSRQNVAGPGQQWNCYTPTGGTNAAMQMNGYSGGNNANEDWLITPRINLSGSNGILVFRMQKSFTGTEPDVLYSNSYDGTSAPSSTSWTSLNIPMSVSDTGNYKTYSAALSPAITATPFFIAFKYVSTTTDGYRVRLDSVVVNSTAGIANISSKANNMAVSVLGNATNGNVQVAFNVANAGTMQAAIYDLTGRLVYSTSVVAAKGDNKLTLTPESLQHGIYIIRIGNGTQQGVARTFVQ